MARSKINVGNLINITGGINIAGRDNFKNVKMVHKRALPSWKNRRREVSKGVKQ